MVAKSDESIMINEGKLPLQSLSSVDGVGERQEGVLFNQIEWLQSQLGLTNRQLASYLFISVSTLKNWRKERKPVTNRLIAEQVISLVSLTQRGNRIFSKTNGFSMWLRRSQWDLQNRLPIDYLSTREGTDLVSDVLGRIEHGLPL